MWPVLVCMFLGGCAAVTNPVADGIPVHRLPTEILGLPREEEVSLPLTLLRQKPADAYQLDVGDVLGIWIEGVLGNPGQPPPVVQPPPGSNLPASVGYPIPVREDGTIALPYIEPLPVRGMTIGQVREELRKAYTVTRQILKPGTDRILVDLQRPREYHVLVIRQDSGGVTLTATGVLGSTKRGTGFQLQLPAYENDVLNALARTGGFPGLDARNEVIIERAPRPGDPQTTAAPRTGYDNVPAGWGGGQRIRIPLRLRAEQQLPFRTDDIVLNTGDIVYIDSRDTELFYTGGLLGSNQFILPRDYDLDVVEAIALARGPLVSGGINQNNFTGGVLQAGIGFPSPSLLTVLRKMPNGKQITIRVDLNKALRDPRERILVQADDILILQETLGEAMVRYFNNQVRFNLLATLFQRDDAIGTATATGP
jgi:protein involved in polysaccharide export with SLBB domain